MFLREERSISNNNTPVQFASKANCKEKCADKSCSFQMMFLFLSQRLYYKAPWCSSKFLSDLKNKKMNFSMKHINLTWTQTLIFNL